MPKITKEEMEALLKDVAKNYIPFTLNISKINEEQALSECDEYIKTGNKNVNGMNPLSVYFIISKLPEEKQIRFLKENIKYIKEHDKDIFLYTMMAPRSLSYFLSFNVLKELLRTNANILWF